MLTKNEISTLSLSPTKKDFVQIWNELLDVAGKLSERWDPTSTNESDPGIVILKALAGIADKLNYNIDKNTLEAFMPTAAQEDSMRKLCDMLGYNMKYYRSAETSVTIKYYNADPSEEEAAIVNTTTGLEIPKFTVITNADKDISYFTTNQVPVYISEKDPSKTLNCMEGQIVKCESTTDNSVITLAQFSEGNKFYLPETQIAENGIFVYNVSSTASGIADGDQWEKVDNLNIQARGARVFKFGYNSYEGRPYIEFPEDCSELIEDGLFIYYTRTSGANGNVSVNTLTQIELPTGGNWSKVAAESFSATNVFAATSGANLETISQAYNNFKKTIGTFETLVTCRDYMNKIYAMVSDQGKPYVSNVLVTDIRNDLNRAITICSCDDAGIFYKETPLTEQVARTLKIKNADGSVGENIEVFDEEPLINHFDLVIYPFKSYTQIRSTSIPVQQVYDSSFTYNPQNFNNIEVELQNTGLKAIAHNFIKPKAGDILSINNYLRLNAIVGTNNKVSAEEVLLLKEKIKIALANAFNMRELDFGEEIPFESIVDVIEHADHRIKVVSLNEPDLYTTFTVIDEVENANSVKLKEYAVASDRWLTAEQATASKRFETDLPTAGTFDTKTAREIYNKLIVRNILAGRVPLFKYNATFSSDFGEKPYQVTAEISFGDLPGACKEYFNNASADAPYLLWCDGNTVAVGDTYARELVNPDATEDAEKYKYTKVETPKEPVKDCNGNDIIDEEGNTVMAPKYPNNIVEPADGEKITRIESECIITPTGDRVEDITLAAGEQIKFRAPNFRTEETYPAYVNYHLHLNKRDVDDAKPAVAANLYSLITSDLWEELFKCNQVVAKELKQKVSNITVDQAGKVTNQVPNIDTESLKDILYQSGCIRLHTTPTFSWVDSSISGQPTFDEENFGKISVVGIPEINGTILIYSQSVLDSILADINNLLYNNQKDYDWQISYAIEYVPFNSTTLNTWKTFVEGCVIVNGKAPVKEAETILWRAYTGSSYQTGKYILGSGNLSGAKLLPFSEEYFGILDSLNNANRLQGVYVASDLGSDAVAAEIANETEYKLKSGEYLCIEYTPSSTNEDGTTDNAQKPVIKVFKDTVIRPNGFTSGVQDSSDYQKKGNSPVKTVDFYKDLGEDGRNIAVFSLGVNEQIEIREPAKVILDKTTFADDIIYVYKNFNNCPELEEIKYADSRTYILKEGEYFFYTDKNKSELAYYSAGTGITLTGTVKIPTFDIIDISTILDAGISEIPWKAISISGEKDGVIFQEYQYKVLSQEDTLNTLRIVDTTSTPVQLDSTWRKCADVTFTLKGETEPATLPPIDMGNVTESGWEVQSLLEINASPSVAQVLRNTDKVKTRISLYGTKDNTIVHEALRVIEAERDFPLSFKTNIAGQSSTGELKLSNAFLRTDNAESFIFKVTAEDAPAVVKVQQDTSLPISASVEGKVGSISRGVNSWSQVLLKELNTKTETGGESTNALKLSTTILPNTYGIFSIYLKQDSGSTSINVLPGTDSTAVSFFNTDTTLTNNKLELHKGLNCICIKKSCDMYITSNAPDGLLCFDTLRLVEVSQTDDSQGITYGLNLAQLGYLSTSDKGTWNEIDSRARKNLKNALTKETLEKVESRLQELNSKVAIAKASLDADKPKVEIIKTFLENAISELDALIKADDNDTAYKTTETIGSLITQFNDLTATLFAEKALQESLENNTAIEDITKRLAELLEGFDDIALLQESLTTELANLYNDMLTNVENIEGMTQEGVVDDFVNAISPDDSEYRADELLKNALKIASLIEINAKYGSQLDDVLTNIDMSNDEHIRLAKQIYNLKYREISSLINDLYSFSVSEDTEGNQILVGTISDAIETTISKINTEMAKSGNVDYSSLKTDLQTLKTNVKKLDIAFIVDKINSSAAELAYPELAQYLNDLQVVFSAADSALIKAIDQAIKLVDGQEGAPSDALKAAITTIDTAIWAKIKESGAAIITKIQDILDELDDFSLDNSILDEALEKQLSMIITARASIVNTVDLFSAITDYDKLPFSTEAILKVWPEYMKEDLLEEVEPVYDSIHTIVRDSTNTISVVTEAQLNEIKTTLNSILNNRPVLQKVANISLFKKLYKRAKDLVYKSKQVNSRKTVIEALSNSALAIPAVTTELDAFTASSNSQVIYNLAVQLKANAESDMPDVLLQQQILTELKEELAKLIKLDEDLLKITAEMLSPSILLLEDLPEDAFYDEVRDFINSEDGIKAQVLAKDLDGARADIINKLNADKSLKDDSLLPDSFTDKEIAYNTALGLIPEDRPTEWDIFKILLDDKLKAAWNVTNDEGSVSYWIDSTGAEITTLDSTYAYRYHDNKWYRFEGSEQEITISSLTADVSDEGLITIITTLIGDDKKGLKALGAGNIPESFRNAFESSKLEEQLLAEIKEYDKNGLFYYNTPVEADVAIDFNEGDSKLNTLMNPATNYDINNVNNSFVISKLDIGYLDSGIQIARSSRL